MIQKLPEKNATIKLVDEVFAIISGLRISEINELYEKYGLFAKNYFFDPKYQLDRWDGKIRFFQKTGKTYIQLMPEIIKFLKSKGYKINIDDERVPFSISNFTIDKNYFKEYGWEFGEHQVKALNAAFKNNGGIIRVGTGGGKTLITGAICHRYLREKLKILIIVPRKDLVVQTKDEIKNLGFAVGSYYHNNKSLDESVIVSTWQSLMPNKKIVTLFDVVIVDECHGAKTSTQLSKILGEEGRNIPIRIGLTGSLPKHDSDLLTVLCHIGPQIANVKSSELIKTGWLAKLNLLMCEFIEDFEEDWEAFKVSYPERVKKEKMTYTKFKNNILFPNFEAEKKYLTTKNERHYKIIEVANELTQTYGNTFILVNGVEFGKRMARELGDNAIFIASNLKDRKPIYDAFSDSNNMIGIATYNLASTGLNIPRIFNLVMVDGGKSSIRVIQSIGRGLRRTKDKSTVNVIDFHSNLKFSKRHAHNRKKIYKEEEYPFKTIKVNANTEIDVISKKLMQKKKEEIKKEVLKE